jgi:hypothetical protein
LFGLSEIPDCLGMFVILQKKLRKGVSKGVDNVLAGVSRDR